LTEEHFIVSDEEIRLDNTWHLSGKELGLLLLAVGLQQVEVLGVQLGSFEDAGTGVFRLGQEFLASMTLNFFPLSMTAEKYKLERSTLACFKKLV
jgi:hypothetical protein